MVFKPNEAHSKKIIIDPLFKEYVKYRNLKSETIRSFTRKITIYSIVTGLTPTQLIEEAEMDEDNGIFILYSDSISNLILFNSSRCDAYIWQFKVVHSIYLIIYHSIFPLNFK